MRIPADRTPPPLLKGSFCAIDYAVDASGKRQAQEFLESDEVPPKDKARIFHILRTLSEVGPHGLRGEGFRPERGQISAIKSYQTRVAGFWHEKCFYLTNGFIKKKDHWPSGQLDRADRIREEHLARYVKGSRR
jgi:hypothetical protein